MHYPAASGFKVGGFLEAVQRGSLSRVYGLLITLVYLKINRGMWLNLIVYDKQSI